MAQLYFYYSAMNAGKSTALLQSSYNYQERGMRTIVYTAEIDDRFGAGKVSSRIGLSSPAKLFNHDSNLVEEIRAAETARFAAEKLLALGLSVEFHRALAKKAIRSLKTCYPGSYQLAVLACDFDGQFIVRVEEEEAL